MRRSWRSSVEPCQRVRRTAREKVGRGTIARPSNRHLALVHDSAELQLQPSPYFGWLLFYFFFHMYKWAPGMWLYWKTDLTLHHVLPFWFWFLCLKKTKKKKQTQISEKKMNRYYAWHGVWKGEIRVILFTYHLRRCVRMVLFVAQ